MSFAAAIAAAQRTACALAGVEVTYRRGALEATFRATKAKTVFETVDASGFLMRVESWDFKIEVSKLKFDGVAFLPERDDLIEEGGYTYQLLEAGTEPAWRYADPYRQEVRVHTKQTIAP